jgi:parvulin-like peptidyl-prolyl isomerase
MNVHRETVCWRGAVVVCALVALSGTAALAEVVDQVVATVDTEAILLSEIMSEIAPELPEIRANASNERAFGEAVEAKVRATLEQAIESRILLREAQLAGLFIEDERIEEEIERIKKLYPSNQEFLKELEEAGETISDLRVQLRKKALAGSMALRKRTGLEDGIVVSESEVAQYYEDNREEFERPERVRCRQVFLAAEKDSPQRSAVRARMELIAEESASGADFAQLAATHSEAVGAEDGGIIGWVARGDLVKSLEDAAFSLNEGEAGGIVETDYGFHILKIEKKEGAGLASLAEVRKDIEPKLRSKAAEVLYKKWMTELRKRSRVQVFI